MELSFTEATVKSGSNKLESISDLTKLSFMLSSADSSSYQINTGSFGIIVENRAASTDIIANGIHLHNKTTAIVNVFNSLLIYDSLTHTGFIAIDESKTDNTKPNITTADGTISTSSLQMGLTNGQYSNYHGNLNFSDASGLLALFAPNLTDIGGIINAALPTVTYYYQTASSANLPLFGTTSDNTLVESIGHTAVLGLIGNDTITSKVGNDALYGNQGNDSIIGVTNDSLYGGLDNDTLRSTNGHDILYGNQGNDLLYSTGNDTLYGGQGNDTIIAHGNGNVVYGCEGNNLLYVDGGNNTLTGGTGSDLFVIGSGKNVITNFQHGNDILQLNFFSSRSITNITDSKGNAIITLSDGCVVTLGGVNSSTLTSHDLDGMVIPKTSAFNLSSNTIPGGSKSGGENNGGGNGGGGGGHYSQIIMGTKGNDTIVTETTSHNDTIIGNGGSDSIVVYGSDNSVQGSNGNDTVIFNGDETSGRAINNIVDSGDGNDLLKMSADNSTTTLTGGNGTDTFLLTGQNITATITDFVHGTDHLSLNNTTLTSTNVIDGNTVLHLSNGNLITLRGITSHLDTNDFLNVTYGGTNQTIFGGAGDNSFTVSGTSDTINTGDGNNSITIDSHTSTNTVNVGTGSNTFSILSGSATFNNFGTNDILSLNGRHIASVNVTFTNTSPGLHDGWTVLTLSDNTAITLNDFFQFSQHNFLGVTLPTIAHYTDVTTAPIVDDANHVYVGVTNQSFTGAAGDHMITMYDATNCTLSGGAGDDYIISGGDQNTLNLSTGHDTIYVADVSSNGYGPATQTTINNFQLAHDVLYLTPNSTVVISSDGNGNAVVTGTLNGNTTTVILSGVDASQLQLDSSGTEVTGGGSGSSNGGGGDTYNINGMGDNVIAHFHPGIDVIILDNGTLPTISALSEINGNAVLTYDNTNTLTLNGVDATTLAATVAHDFPGLTLPPVLLLKTNIDGQSLTGNGDNQTLIGSAADNTLSISNANNDSLVGSATHSTHFIINNGGSADTVTAGDGNNYLEVITTATSPNTNSVFTFGNGDNTIDLAANLNDTVICGNGDNYITSSGSHDSIVSGNGINHLTMDINSTANTIIGGTGTETFLAHGSDNFLSVGGTHHNILQVFVDSNGNASHNTLIGGSGNDALSAAGSNNSLCGGDGNNTFTVIADRNGNATNNILTGGTGSNTYNISGTGSNEITDFHTGTDVVILDNGAIPTINKVSYINGNTVLEYDNNTSSLTLDGVDPTTLLRTLAHDLPGLTLPIVLFQQTNESHVTLTGGGGDDTLSIGGGGSYDSLVGSSGNCVMDTDAMGSHDNTFVGGSGNDTITVHGSNNSIAGGDGTNVITVMEDVGGGTSNNNILSGGSGVDTYNLLFNQVGSTNTITNFKVGTDIINFSDEFSGTIASLDESGRNAIVTLSTGTTLILDDVDYSKLTSHDFGGATLPGLNVTFAGNDTTFNAPTDRGDHLTIRGNHDFVYGNNGNDVISVVGGTYDNLIDNSGNNVLCTDNNSSNNTLTGGSGNDTLIAYGTNNSLSGGDGDNTLTAYGSNNNLSAGNGNNTLTAYGSNNNLSVGNKNSTLTVYGSGNIVTGGNGDDSISVFADNNGNASGNILSGGLGNDTFYVSSLGKNTITDFTSGSDVLSFGATPPIITSLAAAAGDTIITYLNGNTLTLTGVTTSLTTADMGGLKVTTTSGVANNTTYNFSDHTFENDIISCLNNDTIAYQTQHGTPTNQHYTLVIENFHAGDHIQTLGGKMSNRDDGLGNAILTYKGVDEIVVIGGTGHLSGPTGANNSISYI